MAMAMTIAIVGAGRVGRGLGRRLRERGWTVGAVVTRSRATARAAVRSIGSGSAQGEVTRRVLAADVVLVATPDSAIETVAAKLARAGQEEWRGKVVLHTSGAMDHRALEALRRRGAATGSIHPMQTFSGRAVPKLDGVVFTLGGDRRALRVARRIVRELGGVPVALPGRAKPAYHAASALTAGHSLALVEAATRILMQIGFNRRRAKMALLPLLRQTLDNFERLGAREAWTGPIARGDYATVVRHCRALRSWPPEYLKAYAAVSRLAGRVLAANARETLKRLGRILPRT